MLFPKEFRRAQNRKKDEERLYCFNAAQIELPLKQRIFKFLVL